MYAFIVASRGHNGKGLEANNSLATSVSTWPFLILQTKYHTQRWGDLEQVQWFEESSTGSHSLTGRNRGNARSTRRCGWTRLRTVFRLPV